MKDKIFVEDNVFTDELNDKLYRYFLSGPLHYGEVDEVNKPPTGLIRDLPNDVIDIFKQCVFIVLPELKKVPMLRSYCNFFSPAEAPYFHTDGKTVITALFYLSPQYSLDEGGETQFFIDDNIVGIQSKPKRMVIFDGNILHRATSFRSHPRITVALKFQN